MFKRANSQTQTKSSVTISSMERINSILGPGLIWEGKISGSGGVRIEEGSNPKLTVSEITSLEEAKPKLPRSIRIRIPLDAATDSTIDALHLPDAGRQGDGVGIVEKPSKDPMPTGKLAVRLPCRVASARSLSGRS